MSLGEEIYNLVEYSFLSSVFGLQVVGKKLKYINRDCSEEYVSVGVFIRKMMDDNMRGRLMKLPRLFFNIFDRIFLGKEEKVMMNNF